MDKCCATCLFCTALARPYERSDGAVIYGYCFKDGDTDWSADMGKGHPLFLPLRCGSACRKYKKAAPMLEPSERQGKNACLHYEAERKACQ